MGYNVNSRKIWETIAKAMFTQFRLWQLTKLGYLARVLVCKVMVWSKAFFMASYIEPPTDLMKILCAATRCFIQRGYLPKGSSMHTAAPDFEINSLFYGDDVMRPKTEGGLGMWDPALHLESLLAKWVVLLLEPQREEQSDSRIMRICDGLLLDAGTSQNTLAYSVTGTVVLTRWSMGNSNDPLYLTPYSHDSGDEFYSHGTQCVVQAPSHNPPPPQK